ncbi:MAG: nucleotide exchange factor GrpE [Nanoarchaeota archaeon]|nr:nucleotide exchange factor GrpE [Nanoarchaeota archaeon]
MTEDQNNGKEELEGARKERDEYLDGWKRAKADFINYKKEEEERLRKTLDFQRMMFAEELIRMLENFQLGLKAWKGTPPEKTGMELIRNQLQDMLKRYGVESMKVGIGTPFNPATSECVEMVEGHEGESGNVVEEAENGYMMNGKVIKPAKVKVAK